MGDDKWGGMFSDRYVTIERHALLVIDIRLIALIDMPVFGCISTEFQWEKNVDSTMHQ